MKCTLPARFFALCLAVATCIGCAGGSSSGTAQPAGPPLADVGPLYDPGAEVSPVTRRKIVVLGYSLLKVGMSREEVRAKMGPPDLAAPLYTKDSPPVFRGWAYRYILPGSGVIGLYFDPADDRLRLGLTSGVAGLKPLGVEQDKPR